MEKILLVEDDIALAEQMKRFLEETRKCRVNITLTLDEALKNAHQNYDLLITDKNLGGHRGIHPLLDYMKEEKPYTPVLLASGEEGIQARRELYCHDFWDKDDIDEFLGKVDKLLSKAA
ncbi:MAG: response regulator [archaeon]